MKIDQIHSKFFDFAKKSISISDGIYFELDIKNNLFKSSVYNQARTAFLIINEDLNQYFQIKKVEGYSKLKVGLIGTMTKLIDLASKSENVKMTLNPYKDEGFEDIVQSIQFNSKKSRFKKLCIHPAIPFISIPEEKDDSGKSSMDKVLDAGDLIAKFTLSEHELKDLKKDYFLLDDSKDYKHAAISVDKDKIHVKGETWSYEISSFEEINEEGLDVFFEKDIINYLDMSSHIVEVYSGRLILTNQINNMKFIFTSQLQQN